MVLILTSSDDLSSLQVIKWLNHANQKWIKMTSDQIAFPIKTEIWNGGQRFYLKTENEEAINSDEIVSYWYRRNDLSFKIPISSDCIQDGNLKLRIENHLNFELQFYKNGLHEILATKKSIGDIRNRDANKLEVLINASKVGLQIPSTIIATCKQDVINFQKNHSQIVSKAIQNGARIKIHELDEHIEYLCYTEDFTDDDIPEKFFPTLFQEKLKKSFELRIFFLENEFYSMAIFSQLDSQTKTDFRNYNNQKPNRTVPFELPIKVKEKLKRLMFELKLNCGSIDIVVTTKGEYVFLEVNPIGQYGMVSYPCNYYLDEKISNFLTNG